MEIQRNGTTDYTFRVNHSGIKLNDAPSIILNYNRNTSIIEDRNNSGLKTYNGTLNNNDTTIRSKYKVRIAIIENFNLIDYKDTIDADLYVLSDGTHFYDIKKVK